MLCLWLNYLKFEQNLVCFVVFHKFLFYSLLGVLLMQSSPIGQEHVAALPITTIWYSCRPEYGCTSGDALGGGMSLVSVVAIGLA